MVNYTNSVGIAIKGDSQIRRSFRHLQNSRFQVLRHCGVWMVVREMSIRFTEKLPNLHAHLSKYIRGDHSTHTVAPIHNCFYG